MYIYIYIYIHILNFCILDPLLMMILSTTLFMFRSATKTICLIQARTVYSNSVIDHYDNPRNVGSLDKRSTSVGTGLVGAPACGDVMKLQIKVDDRGRIIESKFKTFGCGSAIASSSLVTEWLKGKSLDECMLIKNSDIAKHLNLPPVKLHCSMLAEDAIKAAIKDYKAKGVVSVTS